MSDARTNTIDASFMAEVLAAVRAVADTEVMPRYRKVGHERKADGTLLTEADIASQAALVSRLTAIEPYPVVGEEMTPDQQRNAWDKGDAGLWCVDPIDGTSNFVHGVPQFAVSVALMRARRPILGVIHAPVLGETFSAAAGRGAAVNGQPLASSGGAPDLSGALANVDFKRLPRDLGTLLAAAPPYLSQRNLGSATLEWCYLAAGRLDIYLHGGQQLWDYAAGSLILAEAGGALGTLDCDDFWADAPWRRSVLAARDPALYASWRDWVRRHRR
ncbi:MAG: inositol monophosphatase family protein [Burkholderiales bacterium]